LDHFVRMLLAFFALDLVPSARSQEIDCEERLQNDLFYITWDVGRVILINQLVHPGLE